jgi:hypothetical protein
MQATLLLSSGEVTLLRAGKSLPAEPGLHLQAGDVLQTAPQARGVVALENEGSRVELLGGSQCQFKTARRTRRVELTQGSLEATVVPQAKGRPLLFCTLHAEARGNGSRFVMASEISSTRLEVGDGTMEFTRRSDGESVQVRKGFTAVASPNVEFAVRPFLPDPWRSQDIGAVGLRGRASFDGQSFRVRGAGQDTCCRKGQFHFTHQSLEGDGEIIARVREIEFTDPEAKAMLMVRQTLRTASPQVSIGVTAAGGLEVEQRAKVDSQLQREGQAWPPSWLRLVRRGLVIRAYSSDNGSDWTPVGTYTNGMAGRVYIGLGVTSYNHAALSTAVFDQVRLSQWTEREK